MKKEPKNKKNPSATENWVKTKRLTERDLALRNLAKVKAHEKGKQLKLVKMEGVPRAYKLVEDK